MTVKKIVYFAEWKSVALHNISKQIIPYFLMCSKWKKTASAASNTWFESAHITMKHEFRIDILMAS